MRYTDHLKRSMEKLTPDVWAAMVTAPDAPTIHRMVLADCPFCRSVMAIEFAMSIRTIIDRCEIEAAPHDEQAVPLTVPSSALDDTQIELAALTQTDLVLV
jgi:hypothetical protein